MAAPPPFLLLTPLLLLLALCLTSAAAFVHPGDLEVLEDLRRSIKNPEALGWANGADPCASPRVSCDRSGRVRNLDLSCANLSGALPASFSNLQALQSLKLQGNSLSGPLPSFRGMAALRHAYLSGNSFDTIPSDFFEGLRHLEVISLANNFLLNASSGGWAIPPGLATSAPQLRALWLQKSGLVGELPESLGAMAGLQQLRLSYNHLSGPLPASFRGSRIQILTLSYQRMSGSLAVLAGMVSLSNALLDGNQFAGTIPEDIDACQNLTRLWLNRNVLVGLLPQALAALPKLNDIRLDNNYLLGPVPALKAPNATFFHTGICGAVCAPEVMYLLKFLGNVGYPQKLASSWSGNDPCSNWPGVVCYEGRVSQLNLPGYGLNGSISSSLGNLTMLSAIRLNGNNLTGQVPSSLMELRLLKKLDVSKNNLAGPLPAFRLDVNVDVTGNPNLSAHPSNSHENRTGRIVVVLCVTIPIALVLMALISLAVVKLCCKKKGPSKPQPQTNAIAVHPQDSPTRQSFMLSLQVLRVATNNFSEENVLGRGGFGIVYKGVLHDGTIIAVKRMLSTVISNEPIDQFQAEIAILKVRHRHLVSILGYSVEDNERLLVYEHMPNGSLSKHLFRWKLLGLEPLSWKKRLSIALDVARGMEYLHSLAQHCFIHRDLKPANILLGDDFRAKVADFGLLRPAPDRNASVKTNVAGTWGYLAPEYVETGKATTKADIFSFGVMLMELITGLTAIDEKRVEETYYLPSWFRQILKDEEKLRAAIDPALVVTDELESVSAIAELAGHCTAQEPSQRPDMGYVVTALSPMVEKWSPSSSEAEDIDLHPPLLQTVKDWQESDARMTDGGVLSLQDVSADGR